MTDLETVELALRRISDNTFKYNAKDDISYKCACLLEAVANQIVKIIMERKHEGSN